LHIVFRGGVAVEGGGDIGDVVPLRGHVPGGSDE
jgi:hypothetical protein